MAAFTYFRWRITSNANGLSGETTPSVCEVKLYDTTGALISLSGATFSATSFYATGYEASKAFDGNTSTFWNSAATASVAAPQMLQVQLASAAAVGSFSITARNDSLFGQTPAWFAFEGSNDSFSWTTIYSYAAAVWLSAGQTQTFYTTGIVFRVSVSAVQGGSGNSVSIANLKMFDRSGVLLPTSTGTAMANGAYSAGGNPPNAFAGSSALMWRSYTTLASQSPAWVQFHFPTVVSVGSLSFQSPTASPGSYPETPTSWALYSSTDGATFSLVSPYTSAAWTAGGQTQTFTTPAPAPTGGGSSGGTSVQPLSAPPPIATPFLDKGTGRITSPWVSWFSGIQQATAALQGAALPPPATPANTWGSAPGAAPVIIVWGPSGSPAYWQ